VSAGSPERPGWVGQPITVIRAITTIQAIIII
jgi:hypothetical protein